MAVLSEEPSLPPPLQAAVQQLIALYDGASSTSLDSAVWSGVARSGKTLADSLRSEALRTAAGQAGLVSAVAGLLAQAVLAQGGGAELLSAQTELARVVGNLCFEHDPNRQLVLDADIPLSLARLLGRTLEVLHEGEEVPEGGQRPLSIDELKFVRATTGAFLNASLKFDPMRRHLSRREILVPLLALLDARTTAGKSTSPVYTVGCWAHEVGEGDNADEREERLQIGQMAAGWTANVLEDVLGESKTDFPPSGVLSLASIVLAVSSPSASSTLPSHVSTDDATDYLDTDIELLTIASSLLESLAQDLPSAASALAFSTSSPSLPYPDRTLLHQLLTFIARASAPAHWALAASDDPARADKAFAAVKAAVVRAVVEAPNNDEVMERLWSETRSGTGQGEGQGRSWLVEMLVRWLEEAQGEGREDMLIAAAHVLAGLGRKDEHTLSLVHDYALAEPLARTVAERVSGAIGRTGRPGETTQILFGVVSLLRHLAIPAANRDILGKAGVISPTAELLRRELDMVQPLQGAVIGLLKHLVTGNISNALAVLGLPPPSSDTSSTTPLDTLLALISRTDELRLRAEGTRVLVNLARTLFSLPSCATLHEDGGLAAAVVQGREQLVRRDVSDAMGELVRGSEKFPILVNEGVVGLTLVAGSGSKGASLVLASLLHPPSRAAPPASAPEPNPLDAAAASASIATLSAPPPPPAPAPAPDDAPPTAAAMLARWLSLAPTLIQQPTPSQALLRPEMLANAASLLHAVVLGGTAGSSRGGVEALKELVQVPLEAAAAALDGPAGEAARRAAEAVASVQEQ
ncbi:uncharacterized protein RHOBADRAFT_51482 [Rhodotorula graminis WP1]|uniref:Uncharacterized protein n=1 Tax=Rhodotorula graminis (strain WP1) TaxID=578459 RepID=A0A194SDY0_RHOGW|nr:uncharacterized protein RHOBADRAFT_51482 [Rhodotorula graminis WP1]KPV77656.1 hypothetical protein RHOBADRAFT_51482 [Rhodotorula graminis WP1]